MLFELVNPPYIPDEHHWIYDEDDKLICDRDHYDALWAWQDHDTPNEYYGYGVDEQCLTVSLPKMMLVACPKDCNPQCWTTDRIICADLTKSTNSF